MASRLRGSPGMTIVNRVRSPEGLTSGGVSGTRKRPSALREACSLAIACCTGGLLLSPSTTISVGLATPKEKCSSMTKKASLVWEPSGKESTPLMPVFIWK